MAEESIGTIFSKKEADIRFGKILFSESIRSTKLSELCIQSNKYLMFNLKDQKLSILKESRVLLYPDGFSVLPNEKYAVYSKNIIEQLINTCKEVVTTIEQRENVITITNGVQTLEVGSWCPPFCGGD